MQFGRSLISEAFRDTDSILYRERRYGGLGGYPLFTESVYTDYGLIDSTFRPLQAVEFPDQESSRRTAIAKYAEVLQVALHAYFDAQGYHRRADAIHVGLDQLAEWAHDDVYGLRNQDPDSKTAQELFLNLHLWTDGLRKCIALCDERSAGVPLDPPATPDLDGYDNWTAPGILANAVYKMLETLATLREHDSALRHAALNFWMELFPPSATRESDFKRAVQQRLLPRLQRQIIENMTARAYYYPVMIRLLINILGLSRAQGRPTGWKTVEDMVFRCLVENFQATIAFGADRIAELLPEAYTHDRRTNSIVQDRGKSDPWILRLDSSAV